MIPTPGLVVEYTLSEQDVHNIKHARGVRGNGTGGNFVTAGDNYPMIITRCWGSSEGSSANGQVILDGNDTLWVTSVSEGEGERKFRPYPRV